MLRSIGKESGESVESVLEVESVLMISRGADSGARGGECRNFADPRGRGIAGQWRLESAAARRRRRDSGRPGTAARIIRDDL